MQIELWNRIDPIIMSKHELTLSPDDFQSFRQLFEHELTTAAIEQQALYKQGYLDCVELLEGMGVV